MSNPPEEIDIEVDGQVITVPVKNRPYRCPSKTTETGLEDWPDDAVYQARCVGRIDANGDLEVFDGGGAIRTGDFILNKDNNIMAIRMPTYDSQCGTMLNEVWMYKGQWAMRLVS